MHSIDTNVIQEEATTARRKVLWLLFVLTNITYLDRLCISAAAPAIKEAFNFSPSQVGYLFSAFVLAYAIFEIPSGWLGDYFGTRKALTRIVIWWSFFTMLTGAASGFGVLLTVRFLFGVGEAGAFPNIARSISCWFPSWYQGRALSVAFVGNFVGAAICTPLVFSLVRFQGWRLPFVEFGALGILWTVIWYWWFRDRPEDHASVNASELRLIRSDGVDPNMLSHSHSIPWGALLTSGNLLLICGMYFGYGYGLYFYLTWLPTYLLEARGFSQSHAAFFSAMPFIAAALGVWLGGIVTDWLTRRTGSLRFGRCVTGGFGFLASAVALVGVAVTDSRVLAAVLIAVAAACQMMAGSPAWSACLDVGRRYAGVVTGFMNMTGNIGGTLTPIVIGYSVERWGSWRIPFYVTAGLLLFGVMMWAFIDPERPLEESSEF